MSEPSKMNGNYNSVAGTVKETIGNALGSADWQKAGKEQHAQGETEIKAAEAKGYAEGTKDQVSGKFDNVVGSITGDKSKEMSGKAQEEKGKAQKEINS
ncbi:probable Hmp1 - Mismatch base pair and cruciform DNA recognition protein [Melanopsichium pennsylvanicum]|uniref:Mismatch base pair and cruciform DNA recognition protein Hmp1 n=2 Tax=Melanopsichium pennsylvanicum TaxID=63383 RepID=A0A077R3C3_9BASI|nr:mismatch base pair and cruciform DNA recognition protein Hmp1 [Melanopsichium pennsylvanicum 4]SNX81828.1 probable Hmp1 - Mismatch base pair and cruciform DNA recognition protein [Melanopsichium pennsylvanicum]